MRLSRERATLLGRQILQELQLTQAEQDRQTKMALHFFLGTDTGTGGEFGATAGFGAAAAFSAGAAFFAAGAAALADGALDSIELNI